MPHHRHKRPISYRFSKANSNDGGSVMRDIRADLEERANIIQGQVNAAHAHFEKVMQQLQAERDAKIAELTETLSMINKLMQFESWRQSCDAAAPSGRKAHGREFFADRQATVS